MLRFVGAAGSEGQAAGEQDRPGRPRVIVLQSDCTTFGRDAASASVFIDSQVPRMISRIHATINVTRSSGQPVFTITSQGMNGILVNGVVCNTVSVSPLDGCCGHLPVFLCVAFVDSCQC